MAQEKTGGAAPQAQKSEAAAEAGAEQKAAPRRRREKRVVPRGAGLPWVCSAMIYAPAFGAAGAAGAAATGFFLTITPLLLPLRVRAFVCVR